MAAAVQAAGCCKQDEADDAAADCGRQGVPARSSDILLKASGRRYCDNAPPTVSRTIYSRYIYFSTNVPFNTEPDTAGCIRNVGALDRMMHMLLHPQHFEEVGVLSVVTCLLQCSLLSLA